MLKGLLVFLKSYINSHIFVVLVVFGWFMWNPMQLGEFIVEYMLSIRSGIIVEALIVLYAMNSVANIRAGLDYSWRFSYDTCWYLLYLWSLLWSPWGCIFYLGDVESLLVWKIYLLYAGIVLYGFICFMVFGRLFWFIPYSEAQLDKDYVLIYVHIIFLVYCIGLIYGFEWIKEWLMTYNFFLIFAFITVCLVNNKAFDGCSRVKKWSEPIWYWADGKKFNSKPKYSYWFNIAVLLFILYHTFYLVVSVLGWVDLMWQILGLKGLCGWSWFFWFIFFVEPLWRGIESIVDDDSPRMKDLQKSTSSGWVYYVLYNILAWLIYRLLNGLYYTLYVNLIIFVVWFVWLLITLLT